MKTAKYALVIFISFFILFSIGTYLLNSYDFVQSLITTIIFTIIMSIFNYFSKEFINK